MPTQQFSKHSQTPIMWVNAIGNLFAWIRINIDSYDTDKKYIHSKKTQFLDLHVKRALKKIPHNNVLQTTTK